MFLPTIITSSMEVYEHNLPMIAKLIQDDEFRFRIPGIHLDGPFISRQPGVSTCHRSENIVNLDFGIMDTLLNLCKGKIALLTLAAEAPGAIELANYVSPHGVIVSLDRSKYVIWLESERRC